MAKPKKTGTGTTSSGSKTTKKPNPKDKITSILKAVHEFVSNNGGWDSWLTPVGITLVAILTLFISFDQKRSVPPTIQASLNSTDMVFMISADGVRQPKIAGPEIVVKGDEGVELRLENDGAFRYQDKRLFLKSDRYENPINVLALDCDNHKRWSPASLSPSIAPTFINETPHEVKCKINIDWPIPRPDNFQTVQINGKESINAPITVYARIVPIKKATVAAPTCKSCHKSSWVIPRELNGMSDITNKTLNQAERIIGSDFFKTNKL